MSKNNNSSDDGAIGCLIMLIIGMVALPLVGIYLMVNGESDDAKAMGIVLLIIGIILWGGALLQS